MQNARALRSIGTAVLHSVCLCGSNRTRSPPIAKRRACASAQSVATETVAHSANDHKHSTEKTPHRPQSYLLSYPKAQISRVWHKFSQRPACKGAAQDTPKSGPSKCAYRGILNTFAEKRLLVKKEKADTQLRIPACPL